MALSTPKDPRLAPNILYAQRANEWQFFLDSLVGGAQYLRGNYLFKHVKEDASDFKARNDRAVPSGHAGRVIEAYKSLISRKEVRREYAANDDFNSFVLENCDRHEHPLDWYVMEKVFPITQAAGFSWVLVDMPVVPEGVTVRSQADEKALELNPYLVCYAPSSVVNWQFDDAGNLVFVTVRIPSGKVDPISKKPSYWSKVWTQSDWRLYDEKYRVIGNGVHNLGVVPFVLCYNEYSLVDPYIGESAIKNIAYLNRRVFNIESLIDEFRYKQCFNFLAIPDSLVPEDGNVTTGTGNAMPVRKGDIIPSYVSPPVDPAQFLRDSRDDDVWSIYDNAGLTRPDAQKTAEAKSGIALAYEFHNTNAMLVNKAKNLEAFEFGVSRIWERWKNVEVKYEVEYETDFDIRDVMSEIEKIERVIGMRLPSPTLKREYARRQVSTVLPNLAEEIRTKILAEIDAANFPEQGQGEQEGAFFSRFNAAQGATA